MSYGACRPQESTEQREPGAVAKVCRAAPRNGAKPSRAQPQRRLVRGREMLLDHIPIGLEPFAVLGQLAAFDRPHLYPATALMVVLRHFHGWHHAAERKALHGLQPILDILARRLGAALGL